MEVREFDKVALATENQFKPEPLDWKSADSVAGGVYGPVCVWVVLPNCRLYDDLSCCN